MRQIYPLSNIAAALLCLLFWTYGAIEVAKAKDSLQPLEIVTQTGTYQFQVELADDAHERSIGLMHRRSMPQNQGMLFDFNRVAEVSMWMKNTYISLDMLFIDADGTIYSIARNTEPHSLEVIPSNGPVLSVLELNAGTVKRLGIKTGDKVIHPLFNNTIAN